MAAAEQIRLDASGESQVFVIGDDEIFFSNASPGCDLQVAYAATGEPYGRTNDYLTFSTLRQAQEFLDAALAQGECPHGWQ